MGWLWPVLSLVLGLLAGITAATAHSPSRFRDCPLCPEMVLLPGGSFVMGATLAEEEREGVPVALRGRSLPLRRITIAPGLAIGRTPVTRQQFAAFLEATGHQTESGCWVLSPSGGLYEYVLQAGINWRDPGFEQGEDHPVVCVSASDAESYAAWLSQLTGRLYRLPSEAEWEYAARAGTTTARF